VFSLPGDGLLWATAIYAPPIARLLEIGPADYGGSLSAALSTLVWIVAFIGGAILYQKVRDLDQRLTRATARAHSTAALRLRIARTLLLQRWREWRASRSQSSLVEISTDVALTSMQLDALRLHAQLSAGYVLSVSEVARALGAPARAAEKLLTELKRLGLLVRASCGADGESGYALSSGGRALLDFHERGPEPPNRTARGRLPGLGGSGSSGVRAEPARAPNAANRPRSRPR
jgi:hypothetical protein